MYTRLIRSSSAVPHHLPLFSTPRLSLLRIPLRNCFSKMPSATRDPLSVAVIGVGLVGSELLRQISNLNPTTARRPINVFYLSSSTRAVFGRDPIDLSTWESTLSEANVPPQLLALSVALPSLGGGTVVLVDNTSSEEIASKYPLFLKNGIHIVTPNKKAFSGSLALYEEIVNTARESGVSFWNEATVGAGLPIISTLKDLVATGDKVMLLS